MTGITATGDEGALLERSGALAAADGLLAAARDHARGTLVLIGGEAGIGKSTLVRAICRRADARRVLWGACDPLDTPRPLGPLTDIADDVGGELATLVSGGATPSEIASALDRELRRSRPSVVVLEDLHWADEATLDVLRLVARRIESIPALVLATYREDELDRVHPLRIVLGELPRVGVERVPLEPLSREAVATLAAGADVDAAALHRRTGGNPFFVTEAVAAAPGSELPATVRDAVLARAARLPADARWVLDAVAIVPQRAEVRLLEALAPDSLAGLDDCLASGMLRAESDAVRFRHEIARLAIEEALAPHHRVELHRRALAALAADPVPDLARLAHHADGAGDADAVLRHAPAAAERAARLRAHRESAAHLARALRVAERLQPERRAELLERRSYECYLTHDIEAAVDARERALAERRALGDRRGEGDAHRWLSRLAWFVGDNAASEEHARRAVELLEPLGSGPELAMAYSNLAQLRMLGRDDRAALAWGSRAIELAEALGETETLVHALNNVGCARMHVDPEAGRPFLVRSLETALAAGLEEHVARAYTNLGSGAVQQRDYGFADRYLTEGVAYSREHDLDSWRLYMTGYLALSALDQGRWEAAAEHASEVVEHAGVVPPTRITPLSVLGALRARSGAADPWEPLDEALELARPTREVQRLGRVAAARAEAHWLAGADERIAAETEAALELALRVGERWLAGELALWRRRAGIEEAAPAGPLALPFRLELDGDAEAAAAAWVELGCPYEAALARVGAASDEVRRQGLDELLRLGARPAAARVSRALRSSGVRDLRAGPRSAARENPAGLTARELEVLALLAEGLRNSDIAERLFLSQRTVAHHVSSILRKLGVERRSQAGAQAARLGIVER